MHAFPPHTGTHAGPGSIGHCPIIHASTTVIYGEIPEGVVMHVIAHNPKDVTKLQVATRARVHALIPTS